VGFQVIFNGGPLGGTDVEMLTITDGRGTEGFVRDMVKGGKQDNGGSRVVPTFNRVPVVTVAPKYTIPVRTPFALTGSAKDADGDTVTYMWEQTDRGGAT